MVLGAYDRAYLLGITPVTPVHMGVGRAGGVVDLPVQRDSLQHPIIYASSLKGAFKSFFWGSDREMAKCLFGQEPDEREEKYASPVSLMDAVLAFIPVREAAGGVVFASSPLALGRVLDYVLVAEAAGLGGGLSAGLERLLGEVSSIERGGVFSLGGAAGKGEVFVGGQRFSVKECRGCGPDAVGWLSGFVPSSLKGFAGKILVFSEDDFREVIERALIRLTRVRLDRARKTVQRGGLWTEEYVPQGSVFVSVALSSSARARQAKHCGNGGERFEGYVKRLLETRYLVIGGKESVGKGVVKLSWMG